MNICIVGLGLIGGSFAKAISNRTGHCCVGIDANADTCAKALDCGAVKKIISPGEMSSADMAIIALPPRAAISFFNANAKFFKKNAVVFDTCGVKQAVIDGVGDAAKKYGIRFVGAHPMAGREFSGFDYSLETLFDKASFIITTDGADDGDINAVRALAEEIGFGGIKITTAEHHDRVIAYTSQLAHIVSNSYCKSDTINQKEGFCAGSFADMTRVGKLDVGLWTELFMMNISALNGELDNIIQKLSQFKEALYDGDETRLRALLTEGNDIKINSLKQEQQNLKNPQ